MKPPVFWRDELESLPKSELITLVLGMQQVVLTQEDMIENRQAVIDELRKLAGL